METMLRSSLFSGDGLLGFERGMHLLTKRQVCTLRLKRLQLSVEWNLSGLYINVRLVGLAGILYISVYAL